MDKKCHLLVKIGNVFKRCYLQHNNTKKVLILDDSLGKYTFTINPTPSNAVVRFYAIGHQQVGNTISVPRGTSVRYSVSRNDYKTVENTVTISSNTTLNVALEEIFYKIDTEDYTYNLYNKKVTMTKYTGSATDIVSPNLEEEDA